MYQALQARKASHWIEPVLNFRNEGTIEVAINHKASQPMLNVSEILTISPNSQSSRYQPVHPHILR